MKGEGKGRNIIEWESAVRVNLPENFEIFEKNFKMSPKMLLVSFRVKNYRICK
jgi:hypothetical protein